jgi:hypothetical protein
LLGLLGRRAKRFRRIVPILRQSTGGGRSGVSPGNTLVDNLQFDRPDGEPIADRQRGDVKQAPVEPRVFIEPADDGGLATTKDKAMPWSNTLGSQTERTSFVGTDGAFQAGEPYHLPAMLGAAQPQDEVLWGRTQKAWCAVCG